MAFNPFTTFRKYQKFWMATILLVCMVTFVLCTGVGGDLSDRIINWFARSSGNKLARLDGRNLNMTELLELKEQRVLADKFARKAFEILDRNVTEYIKGKDKLSEEQQRRFLPEAALLKANVDKVLPKKHYWDTGTKLEDLVDFIMWRNVADRLNIELTEQSVYLLFKQETFEQVFSDGTPFFLPQHAQEILVEARSHRNVTWGAVIEALRDEFRVRLAKLAAIEAQVHAYQARREKGGFAQLKVPWLPEYPWPIVPEVRSPLTPYDLWEHYRKIRAEHDVSLIPVAAQDYAAAVTKPTPQELDSFYRERRKLPYDPALPEAGLRMPQKLKAEFIMGDAQAKHYQTPAKAVTHLRMYAAALNRAAPVLANAIELAAIRPAQETEVEKFLKLLGNRFLTDELGDNTFVRTLYQRYGGGKPTLDGALYVITAVPMPGPSAIMSIGLYQSASLRRFERENAADLGRERTNRALLAGGLLQLGSVQTPLPPQLLYEAWKPTALAKIKTDLVKAGVDNLAIDWVKRNMSIARTQLERTKGPESMKLKVDQVVDKYGLVRGATKDFHDRFTIGKAPELKPLQDAYQKEHHLVNFYEGRGSTGGQLKEDQFYRLFFDNEAFSAASREYYVRPWPPQVSSRPGFRPRPEDIELIQDPQMLQHLVQQFELGEAKTIDFFETASKPILFWKTEDKAQTEPPEVPFEKLEPDLQKRVEDLWRLEKAREAKALPKAQEIAETLQKTAGENLARVAEAEAKKLKREAIPLNRVAHLAARDDNPEVRRYRDFRLPKDTFEYPRDDMVKEVLALIDAKGPIETGIKDLDDLNKNLFDKSKGLSKQIQVLTNKPRTLYYVAVVVNAPGPSPADFQRAYKNALGGRDEFVYRAHQELANSYLEEITLQLRRQQDYDISASKDDRKAFD